MAGAYFGDNESFGFGIGFPLKAGLMFTFAKIPGLFLNTYYSYNIALINKNINNHHIIGAGIGYWR
jgi:hypothetical protein